MGYLNIYGDTQAAQAQSSCSGTGRTLFALVMLRDAKVQKVNQEKDEL